MSATVQVVDPFPDDPEVTGAMGYRNYKVRFAELLSYEPVQRWLRKRQPTTRSQYLEGLENILDWTGKEIQAKTPDTFLAWAKQTDGLAVQDLIDKYASTQKKSIGQKSTALLRSFLSRNGMMGLPKIDWESTVGDGEGYKREELLTLLEFLDNPFQKLYVKTGADTGFRANDILALKYKHIKEDLEAGKEFVAVKFEKERYNRRKAPGRSFLGPQSLAILRGLVKEGKISTSPEAKIFPFSYRLITYYLDQAKKRGKLNQKLAPSHAIRKFYTYSLDRADPPIDYHRKLMLEGHSLAVRTSYTSKDLEPLRAEYARTYKYRDLSEKAVVSTEVTDLQSEVRRLKEELARRDQGIPEVLEEVRKLRKRVEELEKET